MCFYFRCFTHTKKTLEKSIDSGNDIIVQVKKNQEGLYYDCIRTSRKEVIDVYEETLKRVRNRIEQRKVEVFTDFSNFISDDWLNSVSCIIKLTRIRRLFKTKTKTYENSDSVSYYISTKLFSAKSFCEIIRSHWFIENKNHYVRDVSMNEDKSRIRTNAHIFLKLRSFALNIMRINNATNIKSELFENGLSLDKILNYKGIKKK